MTRERTTARNAPRLEIALVATILRADGSGAALSVTTRDLGPGGALCDSGLPVEEGASVFFQLELPAGSSGSAETVVLPARIVRAEGKGPYTLAIQFSSPPARVVELLKRFLWRARRESGRP